MSFSDYAIFSWSGLPLTSLNFDSPSYCLLLVRTSFLLDSSFFCHPCLMTPLPFDPVCVWHSLHLDSLPCCWLFVWNSFSICATHSSPVPNTQLQIAPQVHWQFNLSKFWCNTSRMSGSAGWQYSCSPHRRRHEPHAAPATAQEKKRDFFARCTLQREPTDIHFRHKVTPGGDVGNLVCATGAARARLALGSRKSGPQRQHCADLILCVCVCARRQESCLSVCLPASLPACLSVCQSIYLSMYLPIYICVCVRVCSPPVLGLLFSLSKLLCPL